MGQSDGEGRLQFVEWFGKFYLNTKNNKIVIFDPYFEDAGLGLVLLLLQHQTLDYIIFYVSSQNTRSLMKRL